MMELAHLLGQRYETYLKIDQKFHDFTLIINPPYPS